MSSKKVAIRLFEVMVGALFQAQNHALSIPPFQSVIYNVCMFSFIFNFFSRYVNPFEKKCDKFFRSVKSHSSGFKVQKTMESLMQENLVVLNLWLEKRYKNYVYLTKRTRRRMYKNVESMKSAFAHFVQTHQISQMELAKELKSAGLRVSSESREKITYLALIMEWLKPGNHYVYQEAANFGKLLKDPAREKLIGDCNQIVTLYAFLFAQKYSIGDLKIKLLPGHVCLHFEGIDIEATNATFQKYTKFDALLPITELISTNLLDVADVEAQTAAIDSRTIVKSAQLAVLISSQRSIVDRNLDIAYRNLGILLMNQHEYDSAIFYLEKLAERNSVEARVMLRTAYRHAAVYFLQKKNFEDALRYAIKSGDFDVEREIYFNQYNALAKTVQGIKTVAAARSKRSTYKKMRDLARKAKDRELERSIEKILRDIG